MYLSIIFPLKISDMRKIQRDVEKQKKAAEMALNEDSMTELRVRVRDTSSGKILKGENAPLASELEAWLEKVCLKFIYSEKATKFCEISTLLLTGTT